MNRQDRDNRLVELVRSRGTTRIEDLSCELGLAPSTIRRDLARLAANGQVIRTYGGAATAGNGAGQAPGTGPRAYAEKRRIATVSAALVQDGQTIAISSGTTAVEFARELVHRRDLTVITNSLDVANVIVDQPGIQLVLLGGVVRPRMHSLLGHLTEQACHEVRADVLFMGIGAISLERGLMNDYMPEILTDRAIRGIAGSVVVMADSAKFETLAPAFVFGLEEVDIVVTDSGIDPAVVRELSARGIRVIVA
jgi:DeoR/GlpR family transcriptional regulator of sugar metabolism